MAENKSTKQAEQAEYKVLARKYRPSHFKEMIGQDALVQTLSNALDSGRIAHAYMLHGIRGVGKTTTARIMARALNYGDKDAKPTSKFEDQTEQCKMIIEGRHMDVIEMDAASRTGVDDIRDIIDGVQYPPTSARYKVYIIDEVHMLSKNAFNALLKTLEEPPEYVKFIFATTEIRKVPVTVLSRCQRFDLKRIDQDVLANYFMEITHKENATADEEAIALIARAADGSARDGLSILDQAIALGDGHVDVKTVRDMLGLADRTRIIDLFENLVKGEAKQALDSVADLYKSGADPIVLLQDLLDVCHVMSKIKALPALGDQGGLPEAEKLKSAELTSKLSVPVLTRLWQMLMKGLNEVQYAPNPQSALEMVLIRVLYMSDLPTPGDLAKLIKSGEINVSAQGAHTHNSETTSSATAQKKTELKAVASNPRAVSSRGNAAVQLRVVEEEQISAPVIASPIVEEVTKEDLKEETTENVVIINPNSFESVVALFGQMGEVLLQINLKSFVRLIKCENNILEFHPLANAKHKLDAEIQKYLRQWTNQNWQVRSNTSVEGMPTLTEQVEIKKKNTIEQVKEHDDFKKVVQLFPYAEIIDVEPFI